MNRSATLLLAASVFAAPALLAERAEFSVFGGGSFANSNTVAGPEGSADAGFKSGLALGVAVGQNMYRLIGGEVRYMYEKQDLKLSSGGTEVGFAGESHLVHYDLLIHAAPRGSRVRPYVAAGGGVKYYRGTGREVAFQPLGNIAVLTKTNQAVGLVSVGGGVKFELSKNIMLRLDVHDYATPVPRDVIAPVPPGKISGWFHNIVPAVGISFTF